MNARNDLRWKMHMCSKGLGTTSHLLFSNRDSKLQSIHGLYCPNTVKWMHCQFASWAECCGSPGCRLLCEVLSHWALQTLQGRLGSASVTDAHSAVSPQVHLLTFSSHGKCLQSPSKDACVFKYFSGVQLSDEWIELVFLLRKRKR